MASRPKVFVREEVTSPLDDIVERPLNNIEAYEPPAPSKFRDELPTLGFKSVQVEEAYETVSLKLPKDLSTEYRKIAESQELTLEEVLQHRLQACRSHNALRGLWFSDSERGQLENYLQKWPLESASQAINIIAKAALVKFDEIQVTLTPAQKRVLSLSMFGGRTPQSFFEAMVKREFKC